MLPSGYCQDDRRGHRGEALPANWGRVQQTYQAIIGRLPRTAPRQLVEAVCAEMQELSTQIRDVLESFAKAQNPDANESHSDRHIQNSNPDPLSESERGFPESKEAAGIVAETDNVRSLPKRELPLGIVLDACPSLRELGQGGEIRHWRDFLAAAELARPSLGISPSAWRDARDILGEQHAAITLAAIYQRADQINNAGGYLRSLTDRAKKDKFSTWPMVMALLRARLDAQKATGNGGSPAEGGAAVDAPRIQASEALLKSLNKPRPR
jgi:replication initiation protein RepC